MHPLICLGSKKAVGGRWTKLCRCCFHGVGVNLPSLLGLLQWPSGFLGCISLSCGVLFIVVCAATPFASPCCVVTCSADSPVCYSTGLIVRSSARKNRNNCLPLSRRRCDEKRTRTVGSHMACNGTPFDMIEMHNQGSVLPDPILHSWGFGQHLKYFLEPTSRFSATRLSPSSARYF